MSGTWLAIGGAVAGLLLIVLLIAALVNRARRRREWVVLPEGILESRLQPFDREADKDATASESAPEPTPEVPAPEPAPAPAPEPAPEPPTPPRMRGSGIEIVAGDAVIGVVEGSESHRRLRACADELLGDLKEARSASR